MLNKPALPKGFTFTNRKVGQGFTLIELLVVIAILGVLATLVTLNFRGTSAKARNTKRQAEVKQYQNALEIFANKNNGFYPSRTAGSGISISLLCSDISLSPCVDDPQSPVQIYRYQSNGTSGGNKTGTQYVLWTKLENETNYFVVCSTGLSGSIVNTTSFAQGNCPL